MSKKLNLFAFVTLVLTAVGLEFFQRVNLANPLPFALTLLAALGGALLGYFGAAATISANVKEKRRRKLVVLLSFPVFGMLAGTLVMRSLVLQVAFAGVATTPQLLSLNVEEADRTRNGTYRYIISLPGGGRSFRVLVDRALYEKVGPKKPPAMLHCIRMPVEKGRWGVRRVVATNYSDPPLGVQRYHACDEAL
jgi:lysylphosphatidylglycerol synthetase-like protein (DUF2156 family)